VFRLALRQTEGLIGSVLQLLGLCGRRLKYWPIRIPGAGWMRQWTAVST
jgi:hypothetical protein